MLIQDRYASAIRSSNLQTDERTTYSDTDVLGAFGLAGKEHPLSVALQRLFLGDNGAAEAVVGILAELVRQKANGMRLRMSVAVSFGKPGAARCTASAHSSIAPCSETTRGGAA